MYELIYCSHANEDINQQDISDILETATTFNRGNSITGCLLFHNQEFLQLLEGDQKTIDELYERICSDKRHHTVTLLKTETKEQRHFENWSMAYHALSDKDDVGRDEFVKNFIGFSRLSQPTSEATQIFWYMANVILTED